MVDSEFFQKFRQNYQPKKVDLTPYLRSPKLRGYSQLKNNSDLIPLKTYIRYIKPEDIFEGFNWSSHIKAGGILLKGGYYANDKFHPLNNPNEWTHLLLKFDPSPMEDKDGKIHERLSEPRIFSIKINKYYIFYKRFSDDLRRDFENIKVELMH